MELDKVGVSFKQRPDGSLSFKTLDDNLELDVISKVRLLPLLHLDPELRSWIESYHVFWTEIGFFAAWMTLNLVYVTVRGTLGGIHIVVLDQVSRHVDLEALFQADVLLVPSN